MPMIANEMTSRLQSRGKGSRRCSCLIHTVAPWDASLREPERLRSSDSEAETRKQQRGNSDADSGRARSTWGGGPGEGLKLLGLNRRHPLLLLLRAVTAHLAQRRWLSGRSVKACRRTCRSVTVREGRAGLRQNKRDVLDCNRTRGTCWIATELDSDRFAMC